MKLAGICGHFGDGSHTDGQTVKTRILYEKLCEFCGEDNIAYADTNSWKKRIPQFLSSTIKLFKNSKNIIIMPAFRGIRVFVPLYSFLNKFGKKKLHYIVIGGWLPKLLDEHPSMIKKLKKFDGIYVESNNMIEKLEAKGFNNVYYMPNFKNLEILDEPVEIQDKEPYKLCTFSRLVPLKGIDIAAHAVDYVNEQKGRPVFKLDVYGAIHPQFTDWWSELEKSFSDAVSYAGVVPYDKTTGVLKDYYALLFPTLYKTEGMPGTILDAYSAGLPVIASEWQNSHDMIDDGKSGLLLDMDNVEEALKKTLLRLADNPGELKPMRQASLNKAARFLSDNVVKDFIKYLGK